MYWENAQKEYCIIQLKRLIGYNLNLHQTHCGTLSKGQIVSQVFGEFKIKSLRISCHVLFLLEQNKTLVSECLVGYLTDKYKIRIPSTN